LSVFAIASLSAIILASSGGGADGKQYRLMSTVTRPLGTNFINAVAAVVLLYSIATAAS
jgi:hypothetical protein